MPRMDPGIALPTFKAIHQAICQGLVRACHDLSEGGLAVAAAEMAFAGGLGLRLDVAGLSEQVGEVAALFAESNSRFLCEVTADNAAAFEELLEGIPLTRLGEVVDDGQLSIDVEGRQLLARSLEELKEAWQQPLRW